MSRELTMNDGGKSDDAIVPKKAPNRGRPGEGLEGRAEAKGNMRGAVTLRTQSRGGVSPGLLHVRERARAERKARFTCLRHHVSGERLKTAYLRLNRKSAAGLDGITWAEYGERLGEHLQSLEERLRSGAYRAGAGRRVRIPKADGGERLLAIANLEDKIVQTATSEVLEAIYEEDFKGFSYGFRPGRSQHQALDALAAGIFQKRVNWILDADIRSFFDTIDHKWMVKMLGVRIGDRGLLRWIRQWLVAGVSEHGKTIESAKGIPQGGAISPLLANVYLHYVFDLWAHVWRERIAKGDVILIRYADDTIVGFERREDAERFRRDLESRLEKFGLALNPDKTRLLEFGRYAEERRRRAGHRKAESFDFLGLTHVCGRSRNGRFLLVRRTSAKRMRRRLREMKEELIHKRHLPIAEQGAWLRKVVQGYFNYHAVPTNSGSLHGFRSALGRTWWQSLNRRSQKRSVTWGRMLKLKERWIPRVEVRHPWPLERFARHTQGGSPVQ